MKWMINIFDRKGAREKSSLDEARGEKGSQRCTSLDEGIVMNYTHDWKIQLVHPYL